MTKKKKKKKKKKKGTCVRVVRCNRKCERDVKCELISVFDEVFFFLVFFLFLFFFFLFIFFIYIAFSCPRA